MSFWNYMRGPRGKYGTKMFSQKQEAFIRENSSNYTAKELAEMMGFKYTQISSFLSRNKLPRKIKKSNWSKQRVINKKELPKSSIDRSAFTNYSNKQFV